MKHTIYKNMRKLLLSLSAAAIIISSTSITASTSFAAVRQTRQISTHADAFDKVENHVSVVADLINELPNQYSQFTTRDQMTFNRAKQLMDELSRDEMFMLLSNYETAFDKYNDIYGQEKIINANR